MFHNNSYHIGRLYQLETRVDPHNCRVVGLEVVSEGSLLRLGHSGFSMDQENGTIMVCIIKTLLLHIIVNWGQPVKGLDEFRAK